MENSDEKYIGPKPTAEQSEEAKAAVKEVIRTFVTTNRCAYMFIEFTKWVSSMNEVTLVSVKDIRLKMEDLARDADQRMSMWRELLKDQEPETKEDDGNGA